MDGGGRIDRDSDLGDDSPMSHIDEHSDREDDMRDCDSSDEGVNVHPHTSIAPGMDFGRSPDHHNDGHLSLFGSSQASHFGHNHPLGVLGNLTALNMGVSGLQGLSGLQSLHHGDVLEKLKIQVRDMKVVMDQQDFQMHPFGSSLQTPANTSFTVPSISNSQPQNLSQSQSNSTNGFPFTTPTVPCTKDGNPGSNSSTSSETSNSSQQNNGWSFEEQYKQVRQLYEINDDPKRKEFLDDLFSFMQKRGTPINRLPIMAKSVLDLYELYNLVIARGGLVDVINKKLWQEIIKGLHLPSSITSAAFTLRTQYMKYLYPYECEKKNLSTPAELQAAIDGNRREGRRSSYGQFDTQMQGQLQMSQVSHQRSPVPSNMQQMSPLSLVTHGNSQSGHHRLMGGSVNQMTSLVPHEIEQRMMEYIKLIQNSKDTRRNDIFSGSQSPEISTREALNALEMSRVALWSMYNNNTSPPTSINTSPPGNEPQREALNLSESPPHVPIKREREHPTDFSDRDFVQPPAKRGLTVMPQQQHNTLNSSLDERDDRSNTPTNQHDNLLAERNNLHNNNNNNINNINNSSNNNNNINNNNNNITNSHHQNGTDNNSTSVINGMQFKITSRGNASTGDQKLVVAMEFNGVLYEGVLYANSTSSTIQRNTSTPTTPTPPIITPSSTTPTSTINNTSSTNNTNNLVNNNNNSIDERTNRISQPLMSS